MKSLNNERYRRSAAERLRSCWGECVGEVFVTSAIIALAILAFYLVAEILFILGITDFGITEPSGGYFFLAAGALITALLVYIAMIPLKYGCAWFYFRQAAGNSIPASGFFSCYAHMRHIKGTLQLEAMVMLRRIPAAALPISFLAIMVWHILKISEKNPSGAAVSLALCAVLGALSIFVYIIFHMRYMFVPYLYASDPELPAKEIISESIEMSRGSRLGIIKLIFSLSPLWACCLTFFPLIFVIPYTKMTFAYAVSEIFYNSRKEKEDSEAENYIYS